MREKEKIWKSLSVIALSEARDIARAITVCQMTINLKVALVCMRSLVNRIPQNKKYPKIETIKEKYFVSRADYRHRILD